MGKINFIGGTISIVDFNGFIFSKVYERIGLKKVKKGIFKKLILSFTYFGEQIRKANDGSLELKRNSVDFILH